MIYFFFLKPVMKNSSSVRCDRGSFLSLHPGCFPDLKHSPLEGVLSHNVPELTWATWCSYLPWYKSATCKIWTHWTFSAMHSHLATLISDCIIAVIHSSLDSSPGCTISIIFLVLILDFSTANTWTYLLPVVLSLISQLLKFCNLSCCSVFE